jgi:hypothetical protein
VTNVITRAEVILGPETLTIAEAKSRTFGADTNYLSMRDTADALEQIRTTLELR